MPGRLHAITVALAWLGVAGASACNPLRRKPTAPSDAPPVVIFENQSLAEAAVYAVPSGGSQVRIGTVQAGRTATLTLGPAARSGGSVTIFARMLTLSRTVSTGPLTLLPGDRIAVTLSPDARILSWLPANP